MCRAPRATTKAEHKTPVGDGSVDKNMTIVVAIDGPAGAGKSTIAKALAKKLGVKYLDTGAMYRAVTFLALNDGVSLHDEAAVAKLSVDCALDVGEETVTINSIDATRAIRSPEVTNKVSLVATNSLVRNELRTRQREWVRMNGGGVVEGRDIGSVVFPDATLKVYLTASPLVRAKRRVAQSGGDVERIAAEIAERDLRDSTRADSPLMKTDDSIMVDTSDRSIDEVVAHLERLARVADEKRAASR